MTSNDPEDAANGPIHDPEDMVREGMSSEASAVDAAETMASTGDEESAFEQVAAGAATGLGLDRAETLGTGGLASGEDRDEIEEGDSGARDCAAIRTPTPTRPSSDSISRATGSAGKPVAISIRGIRASAFTIALRAESEATKTASPERTRRKNG